MGNKPAHVAAFAAPDFTFWKLEALNIKEVNVPFTQYKGSVCLCVNVASK